MIHMYKQSWALFTQVSIAYMTQHLYQHTAHLRLVYGRFWFASRDLFGRIEWTAGFGCPFFEDLPTRRGLLHGSVINNSRQGCYATDVNTCALFHRLLSKRIIRQNLICELNLVWRYIFCNILNRYIHLCITISN